MELTTVIFPIFQRGEHGNIPFQYPLAPVIFWTDGSQLVVFFCITGPLAGKLVQSKQLSRCYINFTHELTCQILTNQSIKIGRGAWPTRDHGKGLPRLSFKKNWLNFCVWGQFEIKIVILRCDTDINTTYWMWILKKSKREPAIIRKRVNCLRITSKNTRPQWVDTWARDMARWYCSADTLFWQLSIDDNIDV